MKIPADIVGREIAPDRQEVDLRWVMAYNAGLGERSETAHPLFPVCYEWPATRQLRERAGLAPIDARLVHAQHDLLLYRMPRAGDVLSVSGKVVAAIQRRPGVLVVFRFTTLDTDGEPVSTTDFSALYRDVSLEGGDRSIVAVEDPARHEMALERIGDIPIPNTAAHIYTECARIWNPIHTDVAYAKAAGLPDIILHGTATLAYSVSRVMSVFHLQTIRRVRCRFAGMVTMPSTLHVHASRAGEEIAFETRSDRGTPVIERGWIG
jgi:acyl dehydratase